MNLIHLKTFVTVAELRHFARAASACNLSQPAVSHQIAQLEADVGAKLFNRSPLPVKSCWKKRGAFSPPLIGLAKGCKRWLAAPWDASDSARRQRPDCIYCRPFSPIIARRTRRSTFNFKYHQSTTSLTV